MTNIDFDMKLSPAKKVAPAHPHRFGVNSNNSRLTDEWRIEQSPQYSTNWLKSRLIINFSIIIGFLELLSVYLLFPKLGIIIICL